jgi:hypothetical protein
MLLLLMVDKFLVLLRLAEVSDANHNLDAYFPVISDVRIQGYKRKKGSLIAELTQALLHGGTKHGALIKIAATLT